MDSEEKQENMPKYTCEKCARTFSQKSHYTAHKNKKNDCSSTTAIKTIAHRIVDDEKNIIIFKDWMATKNFIHIPSVNSAREAINHIVYKGQYLSYDNTLTFSLFNLALLSVDRDGSYYIKIPFNPRFDADIIDSINVLSTTNKITAKIILNGGEYSLDLFSELIIGTMSYVDIEFKISFSERPSIDDQIFIKYRNYILPFREIETMRESTIITDIFTYNKGIIHYKGPIDMNM